MLFQAFEELEDLLKERNVCIAVKEKLVKDSGVAGDKAYDEIVQKLLTKSRARGEPGLLLSATSQDFSYQCLRIPFYASVDNRRAFKDPTPKSTIALWMAHVMVVVSASKAYTFH